MDMMPVMFTSAAVGAAISSIVTAISQHYERRMRRDELLLKTATELATKFMDTTTNIAKEYNKEVDIPPFSWSVYEFHRHLKHLMRYHKLPPDDQKKMEKYMQYLNEKKIVSDS
jgi:hypothetical protein